MHARVRREQRERASWRIPLRRARRAVDCALRRVETSGRVIDASLRFTAAPLADTSRRLHRLSEWIGEAADRLERAVRGVHESVERIALAPEHAFDAPLLLTETTVRWIDAAGQLDRVSARLTDATALLAANTRTWADVTSAAATPVQTRPAASHDAPASLVRRQPFVAANTADAAKEISRGRAPPPLPSALFNRRR